MQKKTSTALSTEYAGIVFRQCRAKYATASTPSLLLAGSLRDGGRFNPPGEFGALYASLDRSTALAELCRQIKSGMFPVRSYFPRVMLQFEVQISRVYDLTASSNIKTAGLTRRDLIPTKNDPDNHGHEACQQAARNIRDQGFEAVLYPSATGQGNNIAIFVDQLLSDSKLKLIPIIETIPTESVQTLLG